MAELMMSVPQGKLVHGTPPVVVGVFQYWLELLPSLNVVPPTPVTKGFEAGKSTAGPRLAAVARSQSAAPLSPEATAIVIPCPFANWEAVTTVFTSAVVQA